MDTEKLCIILEQSLFIRGFRVKRFFWKLPRHIKGAAEPEPDPRREPEMEVVPILSVVEVRLLF